jgi:hypothetical protein
MIKQTYEAPAVTVLGTFEEMTKATNQGNFFDQTIVAGAPANPNILS